MASRNAHIRGIERVHGRPLRWLLLDLRYRRDLHVPEIADIFGIPLGTVHSWYQREGLTPRQLARARAMELLIREFEEVAS